MPYALLATNGCCNLSNGVTAPVGILNGEQMQSSSKAPCTKPQGVVQKPLLETLSLAGCQLIYTAISLKGSFSPVKESYGISLAMELDDSILEYQPNQQCT